MTSVGLPGRAAPWILGATAIAAALLWALHGHVLAYPFLADDYFFLWETRGGGAAALFGGLLRRANYWRPLGREIYFAAVHGAFGDVPAAFRIVNGAALVGTLALLGTIGARLGGARLGVLAVALYALLPSHRVTLAWISCAQDLLATLLATGAALLFVLDRARWAALAFFLALFCKESVAPLPLALFGWVALERGSFGEGWRRTRPLWLAGAAWAITVLVARATLGAWNEWHGGAAVADVQLSPSSLAAGLVGGVRALLFLEAPLGAFAAALRHPSAPVLALGLAAVLGAVASVAPRGEGSRALRLGMTWTAAGLLPLLLVGHVFSSYYVSFAAIGSALLGAAALARAPVVALLLLPVLAYAGASIHTIDVYRERDDRAGVSHFTARRMERAAIHVRALERALAARPPAPGGHVYLTQVPTTVGFATAADRALWVWSGDSTLRLRHLSDADAGNAPPGSRYLRFDATGSRFVALPDSLPALVRIGTRAATRGDLALAHATLSRASRLAAGEELRPERAWLASASGELASALGDFAGAESSWREALAADSTERTALLGVVRAAARRGDRAASDAAWLRLVRAHPAFAESLARAMSNATAR